ncbi:MAG: hypothetical protein JST51_15430 [Armatimonadetes bacterium]|nr:hypothetical protein [Armatimonadota bacterium]
MNMLQNPNERLNQAVMEAQKASISREALDHGEDAILSRVALNRSRSRWRLAWGVGASVTAVVALGLLLGAPSKASASDLMRIAENGDRVLRHVRNYTVQPDGTLKMYFEVFAEGQDAKYIDQYGGTYLFKNGRLTSLPKDGNATIVSQGQSKEVAWAASARTILETNTKGHDYQVSVKRGIEWQGLRADRYQVDEDFVDGQGKTLHLKMEIMADPGTQRPLQVQSDLTGSPRTISKWDYPSSDSGIFELDMPPGTQVYDIDASRDLVKKAIEGSGPVQMVDGVSVELYQVWADDRGSVTAVAGATYAYPCNYGVHINGRQIGTFEEGEPFSGRYAIVQPWTYGHKVGQFFTGYVGPKGGSPVPDRITIEIPVFKDKALVGYAKFADVRVNRTQDVMRLLEPENVPFWYPARTQMNPTKAVKADDSN